MQSYPVCPPGLRVRDGWADRYTETYRIGAGEVNGIHWFDRKDTYPELIARDQKLYFQ